MPREEHPIDEYFRRNLRDAEAPPPPSVWQGIEEHRADRRWLPLWFRMNSLFWLVIPAAVALAYIAWPEHQGTNMLAEEIPVAPVPQEQTTPSNGIPVLPVSDTEIKTITRDEKEVHENSTMAGSSTTWANAQEQGKGPLPKNGSAPNASSSAAGLERERATPPPITKGVTGNEEAPSTTASIKRAKGAEKSATSGTMESAALPATAALPDADSRYLRPLQIAPDATLIGLSVLRGPAPRPYVLPPAEWVLSGTAAWYDVKREWRGRNDPLATALNNTEARTSTVAFGALLGRHWRSGWGLSIGVAGERSEQHFNFVDRRTEVTHEVINYLVTLDSQVFFSSSDTIEHFHTIEKRYEGINRKSTVRIPVEGHYHRSRGRLHYGVRAGLAVELTFAEQDHSLTLDDEGGRIRALRLSSGELARRHPTMLLGTAGLDLGYSLGEQWSVWASPLYMIGTTPLSATGDAWSSTSRLGLQFRLSHHFIPKRSK